MHLIRISGRSEVLRTLHDIADLKLVRSSVTDRGDGTFSVSAYATDDAIAAVRGRGAGVDVMLDADTRLAHLDRVAREARRSMGEDAET